MSGDATLVGRIVHGNLRIESLLGAGGMGSVYLAENVDLPGRRCAVKVLLRELTSRADFRDRFFQEASSQARLDHPNIVNVLDYFQEGGEYFLVLAYVEGGSLGKLIEARGRLEPAQALPLFGGVLRALDCAHKHGIIHRDIKPSNILIDADGRARLTDFGIAIQAGTARLTASGAAVGTAAYMSPEQIVHPQSLDHRTDVYSAGVVLFEMLTGRVPFDGDTDFTIKEQHVKVPAPDPRTIARDVPAELAGIVLRALEKDPDRRYPGCAEFLKAIESFERGAAGGLAGDGAGRRRGVVLAASVAALAALVAGGLWLLEPPASGPSPKPDGEGGPTPPAPEWTRQSEAAVSALIVAAVQASEQICRDAAQLPIKRRGRQQAREYGESALAEQFEAQIAQLDANLDEMAGRYREGVSQLAGFDAEHVRRALAERAERDAASGAGRHVDFVAGDYERITRGEDAPGVQAVRRRCAEARAGTSAG